MTSRLHIVMGVAGCGKSTIGRALADRFDGTYLEGDSFHPSANIEKMSRGEPLTDEDRWPWLDTVAREMRARSGIVFAGCSALKRSYRDRLIEAAGEPILFVHLTGSRELIAERMNARDGHFMPLTLLDSQFKTLEPPAADELAIQVDISGSTQECVESAAHSLQSHAHKKSL